MKRTWVIWTIAILSLPALLLMSLYAWRSYQLQSYEEHLANDLAKHDRLETPRHLTRAERVHLLDGQFSGISSVDSLPSAIRESFLNCRRKCSFEMANPGERFEAGDYITEPWLPRRRMIVAGSSAHRSFLHYEQGGLVHSYLLAIFDLDNEGLLMWSGYVKGRCENIDCLRSAVADPE